MYTALKTFLVAATVVAATASAFAADDTATGQPSLWSIGTTGIMCYVEPCPWRGIAPIEADGSRGFPINREDQPEPAFTSDDAEIVKAVETAYSQDRCLVVAAKLDGEKLNITRIVGNC